MRGRSAEGRSRRRRLRGALLCAIGVLYALSIPWYRDAGEPALVFGLPDWVAVAVACYAAVAVLNAIAWLLTDVPDAPAADDERQA
jgi:hypothetical protein